MNPEVKKLWLDALRSGEYQQAAGALEVARPDEPSRFCCLGVLCDIAIKQGVEIKREVVEYDDPLKLTPAVYYGVPGEDGKPTADYSDSILPTQVANWAGLDKSNPKIMATVEIAEKLTGHAYTTKDGELARPFDVSLAELNDDGYNFEEIAALVEAYL